MWPLSKRDPVIILVLFNLLSATNSIRSDDLSSRYKDDKNTLPFSCPYELPKGNLKGFDPSVRGSEGTDLSKVSLEFYAEYRAAQALIPCDGTPLRIYNEEELGKDHTVGVIFVYDSSINRLKKWLEEKYHADSVENPIRDLVLGECFDEVHHPSEPFVRSLTGEEILTALCEKKCNVSQQYKHYGFNANNAIKKRSFGQSILATPTLHSYPTGYIPEAYLPSYPNNHPPSHYSYSPETPHYYNTPSHPPPSDIGLSSTHIPQHPPNFPTNAHDAIIPNPAYRHQHPPNYPITAYNSHEIRFNKFFKIRFDDAPKIIYGIAIRSRRFFPCGDEQYAQECAELIGRGRFVECNQPRFSECDSEWIDCVEEDEKFTRTLTNFYEGCKVMPGFEGNEVLRNVSSTRCFETQKCENGTVRDSASESFVGFNDDCACDIGTADENIESLQHFQEDQRNSDLSFHIEDDQIPHVLVTKRHRRMKRLAGQGSGEVYASSSVDTRVLRTKLGSTMEVRDRNVLIRKEGTFSDAVRILIDEASAFDEDTFEESIG